MDETFEKKILNIIVKLSSNSIFVHQFIECVIMH